MQRDQGAAFNPSPRTVWVCLRLWSLHRCATSVAELHRILRPSMFARELTTLLPRRQPAFRNGTAGTPASPNFEVTKADALPTLGRAVEWDTVFDRDEIVI